jgi:leucyl-tRNA synthetase
MQRNWIGRSEGTEIDFEVEDPKVADHGTDSAEVDVSEAGESEPDGLEAARPGADGAHPPLRVFTTRPDTVYGATFMAVAAEHPLAAKVAKRREDIAAFIEECRRGGTTAAQIETMDKRGMPLGLNAINPFNGERIPVWVASFVLMGYGTGAVMSVPGHDERDHEFALRTDCRSAR